MRWYLKSLAFKAFAILPGGERLYRFTQRHISRSTLATAPRVNQKLEVGLMYWDWLKRHNRRALLTDGVVVDYGAGWHPTIPILFHCLGANRQALLDISPLLGPRRTLDTLEIVGAIVSDPAWTGQAELKRPPPMPLPGKSQLENVLKQLGLDYFAPYPATYPGEANSVSLVCCTQVLQHLSTATLVKIFSELYRLLQPGGVFMATIHLTGHFGRPSTDPRQYQHLRFSPWVWDHLITSSMMYFNRCKAPDYRAALERAGFRILELDVTPADATEKARHARSKVHGCFRHLRPEDTSARDVFFVAEKPAVINS